MTDKNIPYCPLMSAGNPVEIICKQERCAWYLAKHKMCSIYVIAHNSALEIHAKQVSK